MNMPDQGLPPGESHKNPGEEMVGLEGLEPPTR